jgi:ubiquinone/menaquinone biosynthesis C-methylase UbiE
MDEVEEAADYDAMDHSEVNRRFAEDFLERLAATNPTVQNVIRVLDVGAGTALIPIEICRRHDNVSITALDLSSEMLVLARRNIARAGMEDCIEPALQDAKELPYRDAVFDAVISNSIVHHIPAPSEALAEMARVLRPGGVLFVRDLMRPATEKEVEAIVASYAGRESPRQQQLFRQSLHAALTLEEIEALAAKLPLAACSVQATSDRHWTISAVR